MHGHLKCFEIPKFVYVKSADITPAKLCQSMYPITARHYCILKS
jgi:hypothetical protein